MFETYRMLGREREAELESEAARLRPLAGRPINRIPVVLVAVIVAAFAFGATVARAEVWLDGRTGDQLMRQPASPDFSERGVASHKTQVLAPDDSIRVRPAESAVQVPYPDLIERLVASRKAHVLAPDDRIRVRPAKPAIQVPYPDLIERLVASQRQVGQARPASTSHTGEAFDWLAALVGASTTAALALALGIGIGIARRFRIRSAAA
jgi:hypothetical protein